MEKKRQNIDNFFRENLSDFELSKKEGNWELLNHLLNEQERKKKNRKLFFLVFSFLILLTSGLLVMLPEKKETENTKNSIEQSNTPATTENNSLKYKTDKSIANIPSNRNEFDVGTKSSVDQIKPKNNISLNEKENIFRTIALKKEAAHSGIAANSGTDHSAIIQTEINLAADQPNISVNDSTKTDVEQANLSEPPVATQSKVSDSTIADASAQQATNESLISYDSLITKSVSNDSIATITKNILPADSTTKPAAAIGNFLNFNLYVGSNIYSTSSAFTNKENISPIAGLEFTHPFSSKFSIGLAGLYSLQGGYHLSDTAKAIQKTYFLDVNENVSEQTIQIHQLHKLYFPLTLYYSVSKRHSFSAAFQLSYLLNTNGHYTEKNTTSGITNESQKNNVKGYMDGIRTTNIEMSLGYQYKLTKAFDVSTRITHELKGAYIKEYFYGVNTNPSWTFQTFLIVKF